MDKLRKEIKSFLKRMETYDIRTFTYNDKSFLIIKRANNKYELIDNDLLIDLSDSKIYTKHNLINAMINEIERR